MTKGRDAAPAIEDAQLARVKVLSERRMRKVLSLAHYKLYQEHYQRCEAVAVIGTYLIDSIKSGVAAAWISFIAYIGERITGIPTPVLSLLGLDPGKFVAINSTTGGVPAASLPHGSSTSWALPNIGLSINIVQNEDGMMTAHLQDQRSIGNLKLALNSATRRGV